MSLDVVVDACIDALAVTCKRAMERAWWGRPGYKAHDVSISMLQ